MGTLPSSSVVLSVVGPLRLAHAKYRRQVAVASSLYISLDTLIQILSICSGWEKAEGQIFLL